MFGNQKGFAWLVLRSLLQELQLRQQCKAAENAVCVRDLSEAWHARTPAAQQQEENCKVKGKKEKKKSPDYEALLCLLF